MSRAIVPGDASSLSRLATDTVSAARELRRRARALDDLRSEAFGDGGSGHATRRRRAERAMAEQEQTLLTATHELTAQLDSAAQALQRHASEIAEARQAFLRLHEEGVAAGLLLEHGRWVLPWGITGEADSESAEQANHDRHRLQQSLDALGRAAGRRRQRLVDDVDRSRASLEQLRTTLAR